MAAMVIAVMLGLLASTFLASARGRTASLWDAIIMLPLATSAVTLGFGYIITATFIVAIVRGSPEIRNFEPFVWLVVGLAATPSVAAWTLLARRWGVVCAYRFFLNKSNRH